MIERQSTCVAIEGRGMLIEGASGIGKSELALALIDRGAVLVGDDSVRLESIAGQLLAHPHERTRGLIEVRNLGLIEMAVAETAAVALVCSLDPAAPRWIENPGTVTIAGVDLPHLALIPSSPVLAIKAELALTRYGLRIS